MDGFGRFLVSAGQACTFLMPRQAPTFVTRFVTRSPLVLSLVLSIAAGPVIVSPPTLVVSVTIFPIAGAEVTDEIVGVVATLIAMRGAR
jgi:hypothetical protein